jgi:hypothetical protein
LAECLHQFGIYNRAAQFDTNYRWRQIWVAGSSQHSNAAVPPYDVNGRLLCRLLFGNGRLSLGFASGQSRERYEEAYDHEQHDEV